MINSFFGLEMGRRALDYFRRGMETAGHNISNADVDGYSRQRVEAGTTIPFTDPAFNRPATPGQIGTGVQIEAIRRLRDSFLDAQYREEMSTLGYWEALEEAIGHIELFVNEPAGEGLKVALDEFWAALEELSKRPDNAAAREGVIQSTKNLTVFLDQLSGNYDQYRLSLNQDLESLVTEANSLIDQIAALNEKIAQVKAVGGNPNDLLDRRDLLTEKLSELIDISVSTPLQEQDGDFKIDLHGKVLVQGSQTRHLVLVSVPGNEGFYDVQVEDNLFDHVDNTDVLLVAIEQKAPTAVHSVLVERLASETNWKVGSPGSLSNVVSPDQALNLHGDFSLQVSSGGVVKTSHQFSGGVLPSPASDESRDYSFRLAAGGFERVISVNWNDSASKWEIRDNVGNNALSASSTLSLQDLSDFINANYSSYLNASVTSDNRLTIASSDRHLISLVDIKGDLTSQLGISDSAKTVTVSVTEEDSLNAIANKINGAYMTEGGPSSPEEWLRASVEQAPDGTYYLTLESQVMGEAQRINVTGDENGGLYVAHNLGLLNSDGSTNFMTTAEDALISFDGRKYLSSVNRFTEARQITPSDGYAAKNMSEVSSGITLQLAGTGMASVRVEHHVQGGKIYGMLEARDDLILSHLSTFDELAYRLALEMNALHYSGHGMGENADVTGTAFFVPLPRQYGAARSLTVNPLLEQDSSLIAAAADDGEGNSLGSGDGTKALAMARLKQTKVLSGGSADFNEFYLSFIAELGAQGRRTVTMAENQRALTDQINAQRQSVMGVNIDEEMMDIIKFQQAFNAMARYITTIDEMLDTIINRMGIVGR
jgi:flagellar hook-associated protein 1 FlgK